MIGDMQSWKPNVAGIIEHARSMHPSTEVVSRLVSGEIHKTNYEEVCIRSRKLASALEKDGIKILGETNILNKLPVSASNLYSKNVFNFVSNLYDKDNKKLNINLEDEIIEKSLIK